MAGHAPVACVGMQCRPCGKRLGCQHVLEMHVPGMLTLGGSHHNLQQLQHGAYGMLQACLTGTPCVAMAWYCGGMRRWSSLKCDLESLPNGHDDTCDNMVLARAISCLDAGTFVLI